MANPINLQDIKNEIGHVESGGSYSAVNKLRGSTATGKYQFIWSLWKDQIGEVTGVNSRKGFLNNPEAQEQFMDHYTNHVLIPRVRLLRQEGIGNQYSSSDLAKFIHLEGAAGATRKIQNGTLGQSTGHNLSPLDYVLHSHKGKPNPSYQGSSQNTDQHSSQNTDQPIHHEILQDDSDEDDQPETSQGSIYDQVRQSVKDKFNVNYAEGSHVSDLEDSENQFQNGIFDKNVPLMKSLASPMQVTAGITNQPGLNPSNLNSSNLNSSNLNNPAGGFKMTGEGAAGAISGITSLASGFLQDDQSDRTGIVDKSLAAGKGALTGAGTGASIGTAILPGVGTAIGAGLGAVAGGALGLVGANRKQHQLTGEAVTRGQAKDTAINNRAVTAENNPYGTQMRDGGFPNIFKFDAGGIMPLPTNTTPAPVTGGPAVAPKMTHSIYSQNFNNLVNKYAGTHSNSANGIMSTAPELWGKYQALDKKVGQDAGSVSGQYTTDAAGINHAAACATVGNSIGYAAGDHEGVYYDPANKGVDLNNHGQGAAGTQNSYDYMSTSKNYKAVNNKTAQPGDAMYYFDKKGNTEHMQRYMADTQEALGRSDQLQSVGRSFQDDGAGNSQIAVYPEKQSMYKLKKGEVYGGMDYATRQKLLSGQAAGDYSKASIYQRQFAMGGFTNDDENEDSNDPGDKYRTKLGPKETKGYNAWRAKLPKNLQWDGDYDLKGLYHENPNQTPSGNLHFPDTYKLPNHPTFSDESRYYNPTTKNQAGHWSYTDSSSIYTPYDPKIKHRVEEMNQKKLGGFANYEDGSTVQGLAQIPAQAIPQDVAPMQPATKGQPQGQPQQNMIDIEKGELRIDPRSGKILQQYTGINPTTGTKFQRHNIDPDAEPASNFVPADPGQFIVTVKDAKNFKNADINNDTITKGTIMRNIINNKDKKHEGNYRTGSYVIPELPRFDDGGNTGGPPEWNTLSKTEQSELINKGYNSFTYKEAYKQNNPSNTPTIPFPKKGILDPSYNMPFDSSSYSPHMDYVHTNPQINAYQTITPQQGSVAVTDANKKAIAQAIPFSRKNIARLHLQGTKHVDYANNYINSQPTIKNNLSPFSITDRIQPPVQNNMWNNIGKNVGQYSNALYNIGQGFHVDHENRIASQYNPNEGNILGSMAQNMNYEPQRQEALRTADSAYNDVDQRTNSSAIGRSSKNNIYTNTMNTLANTRMQNAQYNNTINEQRAASYNGLGQQRVAADQNSSQYNQAIDQLNAQNKSAAANSIGQGMSQMQQIDQNNRKMASESSNDQYMMNTILPAIYPSLKEYSNLRPPSNN